ncbi:YqiA/YcfP family alpha/beta fold hydrolase [Hydrogenophaga flava]|uniref:YqiA/YcfP family alpha/beta fold hydrolase n=1 Tax=Hydrogenophaga flava TaxID=65657 RepID=UPI0008246C42|nr:YqiA/YcfP family alpha/beta fold hydrolase [Hydrogenophaga flava]
MHATPRPPVSHLLYLHGFRSSPQSAKALQVAGRVRSQHPGVVWCCPQLPPSPREAADLMRRLTDGWPADGMAVIGSSLGGFYARWLSLQRGCVAALLNPAPFPQRDLAKYIGEHPVWQNPDEHIFFQPDFIGELEALAGDIARLAPAQPGTSEHLFALISEKDEVLDWHEMVAFCAGGSIYRLPEGDHAISDFERHIDRLFRFLRLAD